jgi:hypothetical protein
LKRADLGYKELAEAIKQPGLEETETPITGKWRAVLSPCRFSRLSSRLGTGWGAVSQDLIITENLLFPLFSFQSGVYHLPEFDSRGLFLLQFFQCTYSQSYRRPNDPFAQ